MQGITNKLGVGWWMKDGEKNESESKSVEVLVNLP